MLVSCNTKANRTTELNLKTLLMNFDHPKKRIFICLYPVGFTSSKLTTETLEQGVKYIQSWRRSDVFILNFEHISHLALVFLLLHLNM